MDPRQLPGTLQMWPYSEAAERSISCRPTSGGISVCSFYSKTKDSRDSGNCCFLQKAGCKDVAFLFNVKTTTVEAV